MRGPLLLGCLGLALLALGAVVPSARGASVGDPEQDDPVVVDAARLAKELRVARTGRPQIRPQAARRLVSFGAPAADAIRTVADDPAEGFASLGADVIEVVGQFEDDDLRARLWAALGDADFPWRPAASRSLGSSARTAEAPRFLGLLADPLAAVRAGSLEAVQRLDLRDQIDVVRERLADPSDLVRRRAALLLADWGEVSALAWLLEDLRRTDEYFGRPTGRSARYAAWKSLRPRLDDEVAYNPGGGPDDEANAVALAQLDAWLATRSGASRPTLPEVARAGGPLPGCVLGLQISSCRRGEFALRWHEDDVLYVGEGRPVGLPLAPGTVARLREEATLALSRVEARMFGDPGCDLEQFTFQLDEGRPVTLHLSKGPDAAEDLRPAPVDALLASLLETLPEVSDDAADPRVHRLAQRVGEACRSVGGAWSH